MLHLSHIILPRTINRWRFMKPYELHQALWKGFPGLEQGERENRFLFRHEVTDDAHSVLVQSVTEPDWGYLKSDADVNCKTLDPEAIVLDEPLRFYLRANPTVDRVYPDGKRRRIAVGSDRERLAGMLGKKKAEIPGREEMLIDWLEKHADRNGFVLERGDGGRTLCEVGPNSDLVIRKPGTGPRVVLTTVEFRGVLRVTDREAFGVILRRGIGRGRAFGCGLLSLARV